MIIGLQPHHPARGTRVVVAEHSSGERAVGGNADLGRTGTGSASAIRLGGEHDPQQQGSRNLAPAGDVGREVCPGRRNAIAATNGGARAIVKRRAQAPARQASRSSWAGAEGLRRCPAPPGRWGRLAPAPGESPAPHFERRPRYAGGVKPRSPVGAARSLGRGGAFSRSRPARRSSWTPHRIGQTATDRVPRVAVLSPSPKATSSGPAERLALARTCRRIARARFSALRRG